jgi:hypothetical protein
MTMKIETQVKGISHDGEELLLHLDGWPTTAPAGTYPRDYSIHVPANAKAKRAFYVGRKVCITIDPR